MSTITVNAGGNLQGALNSARPGDEVVLEAGATWTGNFALPANNGSQYITVRSSAQLPRRRVTPSDAGLMPKIITPNTGSALKTNAAASFWRLKGIDLGVAAGKWVSGGVLVLSVGNERDPAALAHHIEVDRCYIHGDPTVGGVRGIAANADWTTVKNSYIHNFFGGGRDTQAVCGWNFHGELLVENCYLEAESENFNIGGNGVHVLRDGGLPTNIELRGCHVYKPLAWKGVRTLVKNHLELKCGINVKVTGNVFENMWPAAQIYSITLKAGDTYAYRGATPNGEFHPQTRNVVLQNNTWINCSHGVFGITHPGSADVNAYIGDISIDNNEFRNCGGGSSSGLFVFSTARSLPGISITRNSIDDACQRPAGSLFVFGSGGAVPVLTNPVIDSNLFTYYNYGITGSGIAWTGLQGSNNTLINAPIRAYAPPGWTKVQATTIADQPCFTDMTAISTATRNAVSGAFGMSQQEIDALTAERAALTARNTAIDHETAVLAAERNANLQRIAEITGLLTAVELAYFPETDA